MEESDTKDDVLSINSDSCEDFRFIDKDFSFSRFFFLGWEDERSDFRVLTEE